MPVPFIGRLNIAEYTALVGSFLLVGLEAFIRVFTLALPPWLLELFYGISRRLFNRLTSPAQRRAERRRKSLSTTIRNASDFVDLCATFGYTAEEHVVQTKDGYLLGLHRLAWRKGEEDVKVNRGPKSVRKRVVYLHHGLLMNSEVWVCLTDEQRALPFVLVERGFDVWLGNNRGNKYSKKSIRWPPTSLEFWNFSIDEFAFHDIPDSIGYILETTGQESLSYIGFSQGTAQAFASLAVHPKLNDQVNVFIALAPAMSPAGLSNGVVDALVKASPQVLFLLFGRRSILSSAAMWESVLYPPLFTKLIDLGLAFLFNWRTQNISTSQKLAAYPHLYSFTSTKSVVHWFQIIRTKSFQMYDDDVHPPSLLAGSSRKYTKVAKYPTRNIKTPIVLVYGGSDSLVDIKAMLRELPPQTVANEIPHYEHLDFLWARDVDVQVFQHVFDALESFTGAEHTREEYERYRLVRESSSLASLSRAAKKRAGPPPRHSDVAESDVSTAVGGAGEDSNRDEAEEEEEEGEEGGEEERASEADEEGEEEEQEEDKEDEEEEEQPLRRPPKKPATARPQRPPAPASSPARPRPRAPPPPSLNVSTTTRLHQQQHQQQQQQQHQRPPPPQPSRDTLTPQAQMPPSPTAARQPRRGSRASTGSLPDELTVPSLAAAAAAATAAAAAAAKTPASPVRGGSAGPAGGGGGGAAIRGYGKKVSRASASGGDGGGGGGGGEGGGDPDSAPPGAPSPSPSRGGGVGRRRGTGSSQVSIESIRGGRGISLGAGKAVVGDIIK